MKRSTAEALRLYAEAAQKGLALAQYHLGCFHEKESDIRKDRSEACKYYRPSDRRRKRPVGCNSRCQIIRTVRLPRGAAVRCSWLGGNINTSTCSFV